MPTVLDIPPASRGVINFKMFGTPVQIQPWFWITTLVLGWSQDFATTLREHVRAFDYLGGVAATCLYDNQKVVVTGYDGGKGAWSLDVRVLPP